MAIDQGVPGRSIPLLSDDPAHSAALVVPNDAAPLQGGPARSLYIGVAGDLTVASRAAEVDARLEAKQADLDDIRARIAQLEQQPASRPVNTWPIGRRPPRIRAPGLTRAAQDRRRVEQQGHRQDEPPRGSGRRSRPAAPVDYAVSPLSPTLK